jgi:uroporphyrin-III C-methyltransferase / precorrin-2 dehydrogenase / sirohydrochlorin ferrochelatase
VRYYPVFLDLAEQPCVVLGGGRFAAEKAAALAEAGARVRVIAARLNAELSELVANGAIEAVDRDYRAGDLAGARLVVDASGDEAVNAASWQEAEAAGILINVVDRPAQCRFIAPAIVRRDPLLIAISTSGESPFLASALRARLERWLGREWGPFTALVGRLRRRLREQAVPIEEQTLIYRRLVSSDVRSLLRAGRSTDAEHLATAISQAGVNGAGRVALVGAGPGDPDLLTVKARELLADADFVLHDALIAPETLALCGPEAHLEDVGKRAGLENPRQETISKRLIELARAGHFVIRLKGGDPFVFGRGGEELATLVEAGIEVVVVQGVTAALAAPAAAGIAPTMRGVASSVAITTAQGGGSEDRLRELARAADTLIVLMPRDNLAEVAAALADAVGGSRPAAVISNATLPDQRSVSGRLDRIARLADQEAIGKPATLVVGDVVAAATSLAELRDAAAGSRLSRQ